MRRRLMCVRRRERHADFGFAACRAKSPRTYAVGVQWGGLEGRVPFGCPSKILFFRRCRTTLSSDSGEKRRSRGRRAASEPPPRKSCMHSIELLIELNLVAPARLA